MEPHAATAALEGRYAALRASAAELSSEELLDVIELAQREKDAASARQAVALAHLSARESHLQEDGTSVEVHHGLGHQRLDGPELVAPRLGVSVHVATNRILDAIRQMVRTPAVVDAMASGDLDEQRARVVTEETDFLSPESAAEVVARVEPLWRGLTTGPLRQLLARTAAQVDPDAVAAEAEDARARRGLTRRTGVHGTDHWRGDFRVEDARTAWAAVTERARQRVREGLADSLELARADAMMELILEHSDVKVVVHTTRAADDTTGDVSEARGTGEQGSTTGTGEPDAADGASEPNSASATDEQRTPASTDKASTAGTAQDLVEVGGLGVPGTTFVPREWLDNAGTSDPERDLTCDTETGALLHGDVPAAFARGQEAARRRHRARERAEERAESSPADTRSSVGAGSLGTTGTGTPRDASTADEIVDFSESYRVPDPMARLVRLRDGGCRFPGCSVPARQCDLDHVRPWPAGSTTPINLMALCRRHHRIKQRHGWTAKLHPDGRVTWSDPTGLETTTRPVDHLHLVTAGHTRRDATRTRVASTADHTGGIDIPTTFEEELIELLGGPDKARPRAYPTVYDFDGNIIGGPPPRVDLDRTLEFGAGLVDQILVDFPPRPPQPPQPIPF
ncbi:HNH nuclease [Knoellia sinensis KCTC 19936]|uniref:HNH nuclease n=1 Tax=Knoellia sinensis KCTC 19936 TaxID=1385520 RepID=A0A0A0JB98_9MICO|nr:HNH endonuclease signature motif containing protein [Knoellia sinensis]KGN32896.1 HNH nuclease [Knoellia sinensis KCTC 19936]